MKFEFNHNNFHLQKNIWESLQYCNHIVQASIKNVQIESVKYYVKNEAQFEAWNYGRWK